VTKMLLPAIEGERAANYNQNIERANGSAKDCFSRFADVLKL